MNRFNVILPVALFVGSYILQKILKKTFSAKSREVVLKNIMENEMNENLNPEEKPKSRRDFLKVFLTGGVFGFAAITLYPVFSFLKPPKQREVEVSSVVVGKVDELGVGDSKIIRFGKRPVIIIHPAENDYKAFEATCTHLDCTVQYKKSDGIIWCACHNGKYDLNGKNISGPPPRPLEKFNVSIKKDELIVSLIK